VLQRAHLEVRWRCSCGRRRGRCTNATQASIICVDLVVRLLPGKKNFKIEESNSFLSTGLSLSFGVMVGAVVFVLGYSAADVFAADLLVAVQHVAFC
jgi:VIT1/CCC1 family predicted Fe2+/Mn2+ transporter